MKGKLNACSSWVLLPLIKSFFLGLLTYKILHSLSLSIKAEKKSSKPYMIKRLKIISGFLLVWRKLGYGFFIDVLYTCKFSHSFYVVRLPVWCIKLSGAGVILRSHKFHNHLLCLLPLPVLYPLTVFSKGKSFSSFNSWSKHGQYV